MTWYLTLGLVVLLGVFLVAFSRNQELNKGQAAASPKSTAPQLNSDDWHSTFSVYICDHFVPNIPLFESVDGIDTVGDGVINIRPYTPKASGDNATLAVFVNAAAASLHEPFKLSSSELELPKISGDTNPLDSKNWHNGDACPGGKPGKVELTVDGKTQKGDPSSYKLGNGDYLDLGFVTGSGKVPSNPKESAELAATPTNTTSPTTTTTPPVATPPVTTPPVTTTPTTVASSGATGASGTVAVTPTTAK